LYRYFTASSSSASSNTNIRIQDNYAIAENDSLQIFISPKYWSGEPQELSNSFCVFHLIVKNKSPKNIQFEPDNLFLLDKENNQLEFISSDTLLDLFYNNPQFPNFFLDDLDAEIELQKYQERLEGKKDLIMKSFNFGKIASGSRKNGFIFFVKPKSKNKELTLNFNEFIFHFKKGN